MESIYKRLNNNIENAKKALNKPYKLETIDEKFTELGTLTAEAENTLLSSIYSEEQRVANLDKFKELKRSYKEILDTHRRKRFALLTQEKTQDNKTLEIPHSSQNTQNQYTMDTRDIIQYMKIIPIFTGDKQTLDNFISTVKLIDNTLTTEQKVTFFDFIYTTRLDKKTQNRVKQLGIPTSTDQVLTKLRTIFKPSRTANTLLNELTNLTQNTHSITKYGEYIESLISELTEIQILKLGEEHRNTVTAINYEIAFNTFKNGLNDRQIIQTIEASRVKTLQEARILAEEVRTTNKTQRILYQNAQRRNNRNSNANNGNNTQNSNNNNRSNNNYNRNNNRNNNNYNRNHQNNNSNNHNNNNHRNNQSNNRNSYNNNRNNQNRNRNIHRIGNDDNTNEDNYNEDNYNEENYNDNQGNLNDPEIDEQTYSPEGQDE